jgi:nondiscriminating glutamyl-tRNA synthetase
MAPSPTGFFHVGSARTALYNWLFARHHKGTFILRVEDTDMDRSSREMIQVILDGLTWLGLNWDEEPLFQSDRLELYREYADMLLEKNLAYYCYCQPEDLEKEKQKAYAQKKDWQYDRRCLHLSDAEREQKERAGIPKAVRFKVPEQTVAIHDIVFGDMKKESRDIEDFVIMRSNGMPTYNLACVVDDHDMGITHVIRGADHIANTPKQVLLYNALGFTLPEFAHLPLILGPDKSKLSKRHGAISVMEYKDKGYLPEAFINYLALIGWSPGDDSEIMTQQDLIQRFSLEHISASNAVFDTTKCEWMNQQYIMHLSADAFKQRLVPFIVNAGLMTQQQTIDNDPWLSRVCVLLLPRLKLLSDVDRAARYFFKDDFEYDKPAFGKFTNKETIEVMNKLVNIIKKIDPFDAAHIEVTLRTFGEENGLKVKQWIHPLRVYTTGTIAGPPLFDTLEVIGRERVIERIKHILETYGDTHAR